MEVKDIYSKEVLHFIQRNQHEDPYRLALKKSPFPEMTMREIVQQIQGMQVAQRKFPFLLKVSQFKYPTKTSLEQASSELTALFKASLMNGDTMVDLTGGMGIDTYLLGRKFKKCAYVEPNAQLFKNNLHNFAQLNFGHCHMHHMSCETFLETNTEHYDWAYIDPSRRIEGSRKTSITSYVPNIVDLQDQINQIADHVMIKLSPMQDISECIELLKNVHTIWVLSVKNEVKELLLHCATQDVPHSPTIKAIDLAGNQVQRFECKFDLRHYKATVGIPQLYLYQPNAAIIKAELQNRYAAQLGLLKLHENTQLYTSSVHIPDYMGRVFKVRAYISLQKKELRRALPNLKANIITKNFPWSPEEIRKKYKIEHGGNDYLIGFTNDQGKKMIAICDRLVSF